MGKYLTASGLSKVYIGGYTALSYVSFDLDRGESMAVIGAIKSGKTTLAYLLTGLESVTRGSIIIDGTDITDMPLRERNIGLLPVDMPMYAGKTVLDNIIVPCKIRRTDIDEKELARVTDICGLGEVLSTKARELTAFQQILMSLARLFFIKRRLYIIDNVFDKVSACERDILFDVIKKLSAGKTVIYMLTDISMAESLNADRVLLLAYNTVVDSGSLAVAAGFDSTVASVKAVKGACSEIECDISDGQLTVLGVTVDYPHKLFQNVFKTGVIVVPYNEVKITDGGRFGGQITDIVDEYIYIERGERVVMLYAGDHRYKIGDSVTFDCDIANYQLYDLGSERKISI